MRITMLALSLTLAAVPCVCGSALISVPFQFDDNRVVMLGDVVGTKTTAKQVQVWVDNGSSDVWITYELAENLGLTWLSLASPRLEECIEFLA